MPVEGFEVIVSQDGAQSENTAVANAAKYLAYADQTDTFGYAGDVFDVNVYDGNNGMDYGIGLCFAAPIPSDDYREQFFDEMETLAKVETFERVHYEVME
jgi:hypothetical protein